MSAPGALLALTREELERRVVELGGRPFHARSARAHVLERGVLDYAAMTDLPAALRARLAAELPILAGAERARSVAPDRTTKLLVEYAARGGKPALVETVHIPPRDPASGKGATLCVSTQVGCPVGCPFCASGKLGLVRNLTAAEILEQYVRGRALGPLSRSVVMGIGEPLLNYESLAAALEIVHGEMGIGARKITVSTVGFPERVRRVARANPRFELAISLHSPHDAQRDELVPAMRGTPVAEVLDAARDWFEVTGREPTIEYVLLGGVNDAPGDARALAERLATLRCSVNLIPYNPISDTDHARPSPERVEAFRRALADRGIVCTVRRSRGLEADAACGQLRARGA
jgi:23S rRNA (adenine2503-C2)-methyltransferase